MFTTSIAEAISFVMSVFLLVKMMLPLHEQQRQH
jgi:hypothetical protein